MSRATLTQKIKDLIIVTSVVLLTGCAAELVDPGGGEVTRERREAQAQAQQQQLDENGDPMPIRKKGPKPEVQ